MRAVGIVLAGGNSKRMRELSNKRAISAMPIAGSYRSIDFALSNMTNSHIQSVAVFTQYNSRSLNEHLSSSKWWDFGRKQGGLYVFTPTITAESSDDRTPVLAFYGLAGDEPVILTNINTPQSEYDAATKGYVDGLIGGVNDLLDAINGEVV